jgi:hypothetical protein
MDEGAYLWRERQIERWTIKGRWTNILKYGQIHKQIFTEILIELKYRWTDKYKDKDVFRQVNGEKDRRKYRQKDTHRESNGLKDRQMYRWIGRKISNGDLCNYLYKNRQTEGQRHTYGHMDSIRKYGQTNKEMDNKRQIGKGQMDKWTNGQADWLIKVTQKR